MSDKPKLTYFEGRGYAELVRMTLCACNIEFQDTFMTTHDDFLQLKKDGKLMFGQVPLLEIDGLRLVQRRAILHYLAKREGLEGKTDAEKAMVDMYFEGTRDFMNGYDFLVFSPVEPILAEYKAKHFPRYLPVFEKFEDIFLTTHEEFLQLKKGGKLLFGQVPLLEIDGLRLVQRRAILHYLAKREGLEGKTDAEKAMVDIYFEGTRDFMDDYVELVFSPVEPILAKYKVKHFPVFEKGLGENKTGYLVGDSMTLADLALLEPLLTSIEYFGEDIFNDYPNIKKFHKMVTEKPAITKYLSGPTRKPRNTQQLII